MKGGDKFEKQSTNRVNIKVHSKSNPTGFLKGIKDRNPVFT